MKSSPQFQRTELLTGQTAFSKIESLNVIIFGVGGVGSWCAESLIRSGINQLTIVDSDVVCITNINRQRQATSANVGKVKVDELKERLLEINPKAQITAIEEIYDHTTRKNYNLSDFDYVIDAIDSLSSKTELIVHADQSECKLFSSMGAACKIDPSHIKTTSIWKTKGCGLAKAVRYRLRKMKYKGNFQCVYSEEYLSNLGKNESCGTEKCLCPKFINKEDGTLEKPHEWCSSKKQINGTMAHITAIFGFTLAGLVMQDILEGNWGN